MIIFRFHRPGLAESMETAKEFQTKEEMKEYIVSYYKKLFGKNLLEESDIVIDFGTFQDERIGWEDVRLVSVKRFGDTDCVKEYGCMQCIGMCATEYKKSGKKTTLYAL